ncbi:MAG: hypothetical protein ACK4TA_20470 [Saprospiraceae bacterium]
MNRLLCSIAIVLGTFAATAQSYNTAAGMRLGTDWGLTVQQRVAKKTTIEALLQSSLQREEVLLTVLGEQHFPILTRRFNIYYGGGFHKGWINESNDQAEPYKDPFGLTFIGGLEFSIGRINLSYDFKPAINISGGERNFYTQTGLSLRYILIKRDTNIFGADKKNKNRRKSRGINWKFWEKD